MNRRNGGNSQQMDRVPRVRGDEPNPPTEIALGHLSVPRVRGDEPGSPAPAARPRWVFPACAGMNLDGVTRDGFWVGVPRVRRDEPGLWVTSYRRLHRKDAVRDSEIRRLLNKGGK